jgi:hypothetical protein
MRLLNGLRDDPLGNVPQRPMRKHRAVTNVKVIEGGKKVLTDKTGF